MSEKPWPVVLEAPVHHVPRGARVGRDALVALRTSYVPRRVAPGAMTELDLGRDVRGWSSFRAFEGALWIQARFSGGESGLLSGEAGLRRFLACPNRHEPEGGARTSMMAGSPLMARPAALPLVPGPRPDWSELPTRGLIWDGRDRLAAAAEAYLREAVVLCGDEAYVRNPGPLVVPGDLRGPLVMTYLPSAMVPGRASLPLFASPETGADLQAWLLPLAAMRPPAGPGPGRFETFEPLTILHPHDPHRVPRHLRQANHDLRATALWAPHWALREATLNARQSEPEEAHRLTEATAPLARLDRTLRFGIATDEEVEAALRGTVGLLRAMRELPSRRYNRLVGVVESVLADRYLPRLVRAVPRPDLDALTALGPA